MILLGIKMKKVAIIRGPSLNKWEMQNYEPLSSVFEIIAVGSKKDEYDTSQIKLPIKKLFCLAELLNYIPGGINILYKIFGDPQILINFTKNLKGFDILHTAETGSYYSYQAAILKRNKYINHLVVTVWENIPHFGEENIVRKKNKKMVIEETDCFIAITKSAQVALVEEGVPKSKIKICPMGVDTRKFIPSSTYKSNSKFKFIFCGRLVKEKGIYDLIEAVKILSRIRGDFQVTFVGDGPERENIDEILKVNHLTKLVLLTGHIGYNRLNLMLQNNDCLILPSLDTPKWKEQFGMVLIEAMATGKAIIATKGVAEGVTAGNSIIVPQNDPESIAKSMQILMQNKKLVRDLGESARKLAIKKYDTSLISRRIASIYNNL